MKNMWRRIVSFAEVFSFYASNFIALMFLLRAFQEKSLSDLFTIGAALLGIIGALSGLSYAGASSKRDETSSKVFWVSGDRFLHSFIGIVFSLVFSGALIEIKMNVFLGIENKYVIGSVSFLLAVFAAISLMWSYGSLVIGFHMLRKTLNTKFPFKDEKLFDDIEKT